MSFVDTRFHVNTTPISEHNIKSVCRIIKDVILNDECEEKAINALQTITKKRKVSELNVEHLFWDDGCELDKECAQVCINMNDHLRRISQDWCLYLIEIKSEVRNMTNALNTKLNQAKCVRDKYRPQNPFIVDHEFREEVNNLNNELNQNLKKIREKPVPNDERPLELQEACKELKKKFSNSYGKLSTNEIVRCKKTFEDALSKLEEDVCKEFVENILQILS